MLLGSAVGVGAVAAFLLLRSSPKAGTAASASSDAPTSSADIAQGPLAATTPVEPPHGLAGAWKYESGKLVTTCDGVNTEKDAAGSTFVLEAAGPHDFVYRKGGCAIPLKTSARGLSGSPSTACTEGSVTVTYSQVELNGTEAGADVVAAGTMRSSFGARSVNCDFRATGRARR